MPQTLDLPERCTELIYESCPNCYEDIPVVVLMRNPQPMTAENLDLRCPYCKNRINLTIRIVAMDTH